MRGLHRAVTGAAVVLLAGSACTEGSPVPDPPTATATATVRLSVPDTPVRQVEPGASDDVGDRPHWSPPVDSGARSGASGTVVLLDEDGVPTTYYVVEGDDLSSIALRFYPDEELASALDRLVPPTNGQPLRPGQKIQLG